MEKFKKGQLVSRKGYFGELFGIVVKADEDAVEVRDLDGAELVFYGPKQISPEQVKVKIEQLKKQIKILENYL